MTPEIIKTYDCLIGALEKLPGIAIEDLFSAHDALPQLKKERQALTAIRAAVAEEREACAMLATTAAHVRCMDNQKRGKACGVDIAAAIRARGGQ